VRRCARLVGPLAGRVLGTARRGLSRERGDLGRVVAKAQRALAHADIGVVNPGNMRQNLRSGPVTYAEVCAIEAYGHPVMRMRLRGRYLPTLLEQQWSNGRSTRLYTSGLRYRRDGPRAVDLTDARGRRFDPDRFYTIGANELIATGPRFSVLRDHGLRKLRVGTDVQALVSYLEQHPRALR